MAAIVAGSALLAGFNLRKYVKAGSQRWLQCGGCRRNARRRRLAKYFGYARLAVSAKRRRLGNIGFGYRYVKPAAA